jgi:tetratricopeptide (TPR) repeat protein
LEYIPFSREHPEASFPKILEMLHALRPRLEGVQLPGELSPSSVAGEEKTNPPGEDWAIPKPDWQARDFEFALMHCVMLDREKEEQIICDAYLATEYGKKNAITWEARREYFKVLFDKDGSLATVETFHREHPDIEELAFFAARCHRKFKDHERAGLLFLEAAKLARSEGRKAELLGNAAKAFQEAGNQPASESALSEIRILVGRRPNADDVREKALQAELAVADTNGLEDVVAGCYEALLDLKPDDGNTRFKLAHKYGVMERADLSLFHYSAIPHGKREAGTWNNLGVSYSEQNLPVNAVKAYREAEKLDGTLAMSNLALLFAGAGFVAEAEDTCIKALKMENIHKNVGTTYAQVKGAEEKENEQVESILKKTRDLRGFYKDFGLASIRSMPIDVAGNWTTDRCPLVVDISGDTLNASGQYEAGGGLIALAMLQPGLRGSPTKTKYEIAYRGKICGASVLCDVTITESGKAVTAGSLLTETPKRALLMVLNDGKTIREFEKWISGNSFSKWTKTG